MTESQNLIGKLQKLMSQKKSKRFYAEKLGIDVKQVDELLGVIKKGVEDKNEEIGYITQLEDTVDFLLKFDEILSEDKAELTAKVKEQIRSIDELVDKCKIDTKTWNVDRYVQNFWGNSKDPHWQVKAWLSKKTPGDNFQKNFTEFLKAYKPSIDPHPTFINLVRITPPTKSCLIINKQDQHLNKFDIGGKNSITARFNEILHKTNLILAQVLATQEIDEIYYIIGSDQFNSEWTGATVRGTKQENMMPYQDSFELICEYEIAMLKQLQATCKRLNVCYVSGNHDEYVGWHLINWLKAFFKDNQKVVFDSSYRYTKYIRYGKNALMFNHGDAMKPAKLANIFPIQFKDEWSKCDNYYIFTGDKHHEITMDFTGIKFFQLPALSSSKSLWDDKNGHTCSRAELTAFVLDEKDGMTAILKQPIE